MVTCPQTHCPALVDFDATHAAFTGIFSKEKLRLAAYTLWPQHLDVRRSARERPLCSVQRGRLRKPAQSAAYWLIHAFWYSHYPFRAQWMQPMGYSEAQVRQMVVLSVPQLVTVVSSLVYGPAWLDPRAHPPARSHTRAQTGFLAWFPNLRVGMVAIILYLGLPIDLI